MKIMFICHANVCRSFMAQRWLEKLMPQAQVRSRGLYADPALPVPQKIWHFLEENGISRSSHTPGMLRAEDLAWADIIFLMEQRHLDKLLDRYAQYSDKMWLLRDFAFEEEQDVPDPIGLSGRAFEKNARLLLDAVSAAAKKLSAEE